MILIPPTITPRTRPDLATFVVSTIEQCGVRVPASSRLRLLHDLYHSGLTTIKSDHPKFEMALEGDRDLQLLGFAFDQLAGTPPSDAYVQLLRKLVRDSSLPQSDRTNSPGRDAGFEIYIGGVCAAARFQPVLWEEPDVTCELDTSKLGFAAKRIKNLKNVCAHVRKATDQIERSNLPGIVILDLALAFNPENRRLRQLYETTFWGEYERAFVHQWAEQQPKVQRIIAGGNVLGVVVHDYHIRQQAGDWQLTGATMRIPNLSRALEDQRYFNKVSTLYTYALPNQSDAGTRPIIMPWSPSLYEN